MQELISNLHFTNEIWSLGIPLILMALDVLTGYLNAWIKKEVSSSIMRKGLGHKVAEIVYLALGMLGKAGLGYGAILYFISVYIIVMELISIFENCEKLGLKTPKVAKKEVEDIKDKIEKGE